MNHQTKNYRHFLWTPPIYRYLDKCFGEDFFSTGAIRLSSFRQFHQHSDEQRFDPLEGRTFFVHTNAEGTGQTITAEAEHGNNAYILCGSLTLDSELCAQFGEAYFIKINNSTSFAEAIAAHIPGIIDSHEMPCIYLRHKIFYTDIGHIEIPGLPDEVKACYYDDEELKQVLLRTMNRIPYFLKSHEYRHQIEYRFVWLTDHPVETHIDIVVPEAIPFCSRPSPLELLELSSSASSLSMRR